MERQITPNLTASEVGFLWSHYLSNSVNLGVMKYFLAKVEDKEIDAVLQYGYDAALKVDRAIAAILKQEHFPVPRAFTEDDVDVNAPRLFDDTGFLYYIKRMAKLALPAATQAFVNCTRADVRDYFSMSMQLGEELDRQAAQVLLSKGLYVRPPYLPSPGKTATARKDFMGSLLGKKRPLLSIEIAHIFTNMENNVFGTHVVAGFSQVARSEELRKYFFRGMEIAKKHIKTFAGLMDDSDLRSPITSNAIPTTSTVPPFSDRFMLTLVTAVTAMSAGNYGLAMAASARSDLVATYVRLMAEIGAYLEDGTAIMIGNGWLEEPPGAPDRAALALGRR